VDLKQRQVFSLKAQSGSDPALGRSGLEGRTLSDAQTLLRGTLQAVSMLLRSRNWRQSTAFLLSSACWRLSTGACLRELAGENFWVSSDGMTRKFTPSSNSVGRRLVRLLVLRPSTPKVVVMTLRKTGDGWRSLFEWGLAIASQHPIPFGAYSRSGYRWAPGARD